MWLRTDAARLEQVVVNLLTNASKDMDPGGEIWLSADKRAKRLRCDYGTQASALRLKSASVFELFTQSERSLARSEGGLGIGLALVQRLVEMHGGTVGAFSVLGRGSEFVVRLPVSIAIHSCRCRHDPPRPTKRAVPLYE